MKADIGISYLRLSDEDIKKGESESITNQRRFIKDYCTRNGITLIGEFVDDGWSGGNFERPGFQSMMRELQKGKVSVVITKDLSRLGRDMREASYYAEQFFPEHGIRYIAINDNFDSEIDNVMAPFQFAMNEVYLRDGSKKVKEVLKNKRENGLYCACPPYGYKKDAHDKNLLVPDENTAPIVQRIFQQAANGDSTRKIAIDLNDDGIIPPLKYRVLYRDNFNEKGASRASDYWNYTTVKRILRNEVYLGHTLLGKSKKVSLKSKQKAIIPKEDWAITKNTHQQLVSEEIFSIAKMNLGRNTTKYSGGDGEIRKSIFSGLVFCSKCGHALCSSGSVYKGERYKYWYLSCMYKRNKDLSGCSGVRIKYDDLLELVKQDLNSFIEMSDDEVDSIVQELVDSTQSENARQKRKNKIEKIAVRVSTIDKMISKLYLDNAEGRITDERLKITVDNLEKEYSELNQNLIALRREENEKSPKDDALKFFEMVKQYTEIETLTRDILLTFIDRIEVGDKILPDGVVKDTHHSHPFTQDVKIYYKFIDNVTTKNGVNFPIKIQK